MFRIISDSTCDLSADLIKRYDVTIIPLHVLLGDKEYLDGRNISPSEIFTWADANKTTPKTSAVSVDEVIRVIRPMLENGDELMCFAISSSMSATCQNMLLAARELKAEDRISVIDSRNLSTGIALLILEAAELARQGCSLKEAEKIIQSRVSKVKASFVVDTLTYLHRGGRCSGLAALAGGALKLHPRIAVSDGKMAPGKKYRGRMNRVLPEYVAEMHSELLSAKADHVFITHSCCDEDTVALIRKQLQDLNHFHEIHETTAGGVISSHCGPGTLGVLYIEQ